MTVRTGRRLFGVGAITAITALTALLFAGLAEAAPIGNKNSASRTSKTVTGKSTAGKTAQPRWNCVSYVKSETGLELRGDAWRWWAGAKEVGMSRVNAPATGSILVLKKTKRLPKGHVGLVSQVISDREIVLDHANWGWSRNTRGKVHKAMRVIDVSPKNDWSQLRFRADGVDSFGRIYPAYGFIVPGEKSNRKPAAPAETVPVRYPMPDEPPTLDVIAT